MPVIAIGWPSRFVPRMLVVGPGQYPSGRNAGAVLVLKCLDGIEVQVVTRPRNSLIQFLTLSFAEFSGSAALDDDIFGHESIDGIGSCAFQTSSQYAPTISVDRMFSRRHEDGAVRRSFDPHGGALS